MKHKQPPEKCQRCGERPAQVTRGTERVCYTCSHEIDREIAEYREPDKSWMRILDDRIKGKK